MTDLAKRSKLESFLRDWFQREGCEVGEVEVYNLPSGGLFISRLAEDLVDYMAGAA